MMCASSAMATRTRFSQGWTLGIEIRSHVHRKCSPGYELWFGKRPGKAPRHRRVVTRSKDSQCDGKRSSPQREERLRVRSTWKRDNSFVHNKRTLLPSPMYLPLPENESAQPFMPLSTLLAPKQARDQSLIVIRMHHILNRHNRRLFRRERALHRHIDRHHIPKLRPQYTLRQSPIHRPQPPI